MTHTHAHLTTPSHPAYQQGSTTLGIIVGVVLGLGVALGVSLYLANTGGPVQSKAVNPAARIDPPKDPSKIPDPNENLYTKIPKPAEVAPAMPVPTAGSADAITAPAVASAPVAPKPAPPANVKPELDGIGKIAAIVTPASTVGAAPAPVAPATAPASKAVASTVMPPAAPASAAGERYFVQAGAFSTVADAEAMKAKLALQGVSMGLSPRERDGQILQRVRTAPLASVDAEKLRNTLKANGIETSLVKVQ